MYCKKCGVKIDDDSLFCYLCGARQNQFVALQTVIERNPDIDSKTLNVNLSFGESPNSSNGNRPNSVVSKYDHNYKKESEATLFGILLLIVSIFVFVLPSNSMRSKEVVTIVSFLGVIVRITATVWTVAIARRQNRETVFWGILAFFLPSIALIIIGQTKKIRGDSELTNVDKNDHSEISLQPLESDFLGSAFYWVLLIGIPLIIILSVVFYNSF